MDNSPLLKLPPELRVRIYELCLQKATPFIIEAMPKRRKKNNPPPIKPYPFPLVATCRQIRREAEGLIYALNTFRIGCSGDFILSTRIILLWFLSVIGEHNSRALRTIYLEGSIRSDISFYSIYPQPDRLCIAADAALFKYNFGSSKRLDLEHSEIRALKLVLSVKEMARKSFPRCAVKVVAGVVGGHVAELNDCAGALEIDLVKCGAEWNREYDGPEENFPWWCVHCNWEGPKKFAENADERMRELEWTILAEDYLSSGGEHPWWRY